MAVLAVLLALNVAGLRDRLWPQTAPPKIQSIAVLPLKNLSGDPEQEYFADGVTDAQITELGKISALRVISTQSVLRYKETEKSVEEIAQELNVDALIEGSILPSGERMRVNAQLVQASPEKHLWSHSFERDLRDVLRLQSGIARAIARQVKVKLTPQEQGRLASGRSVNTQAHELYLKGRYQWNKRTEEGLKRGLEYFQQAIDVDPTYALAYSGISDPFGVLGNNALLPGTDAYPQAKAAALKALELDEDLAEAHAPLGMFLFDYEWDREGAQKEFRRAIELNPNYATGHHWYALTLAWMGHAEEAIEEIELARRLDPLSLRINANVELVLYLGRQYDRAISELRKATEFEPNNLAAYVHLSRACARKGMNQEAVSAAQQAASLERDNPEPLAVRGYVYAVASRREEAMQILGMLNGLSKLRYVSPSLLARIYVGLDEKEEAVC